MRAKFRERSEILPSLSLSRDDLDHILSLFRQTCEQVSVSDKTHYYDTLDEVVAQAGPHPKELSITGTRPTLTLNCLFGGSKLEYAEVGDRREGPERPGEDLFFRIRDFLHTRKHFMSRLPGFFLIATILILGVAGIAGSQRYPPKSYLATALAIVGILMVLGAGMLSTYAKGVAHLSLVAKGSESNFWERNKDKLLMIILGGIISEVIHLISALIKK